MWRWLAAMVVAWAAQTGLAQGACKLEAVADMKVTMLGSTPLVRAKINGSEVSLVADSGAFFSALSEGTVTQFNLPRVFLAPGARMTGIGGSQGLSIATVKSFTIADQPLKNIQFTVTENEIGGEISGLMGQNILGFVDAYYDLPDGLIRLVRPIGCGDRPFVVWGTEKPISIMPLDQGEGRFKKIGGQAFVNGKSIRVQFDTGASTSMLSTDAARRAGLDPDGPSTVDGGIHRGIGRRMVPSRIVPVASFKIGDEEVQRTRLRVAPMDLPQTDMLLGADFFLSHRVYVANSQHRIYFTYMGGPVFNLDAPPQTAAAFEGAADKSSAAAKQDATTPSDADGFSRRGTAYAGRRQFAAAIADLTRATELAPKEGRYFTERARIYWQSGQIALAKADLDKALQLDAGDTLALVTRAALRIGEGDKPGALADLAAADRLLPKEEDVRLEIGRLYDRADYGAAAVAQFTLWIKAHPDDNRLAMALNARCWDRALFDVEPDRAVADCDAAVRRGRKVGGFYDSRGLAHLRLGQNDQAIEDYDAALALQPKLPWSLYGRGLAKMRKGQTADGKADLAAATALDPKLPAFAKTHGFSP